MDEDEEEEEEEEFLQDTAPGPLGVDGKDVEDVLSIISQSIYREGEGNINCDWSRVQIWWKFIILQIKNFVSNFVLQFQANFY